MSGITSKQRAQLLATKEARKPLTTQNWDKILQYWNEKIAYPNQLDNLEHLKENKAETKKYVDRAKAARDNVEANLRATQMGNRLRAEARWTADPEAAALPLTHTWAVGAQRS